MGLSTGSVFGGIALGWGQIGETPVHPNRLNHHPENSLEIHLLVWHCLKWFDTHALDDLLQLLHTAGFIEVSLRNPQTKRIWNLGGGTSNRQAQ
ncbi:hypothetical protein [Gynuella sunshinyii]|uniref:Uncharacterized protein n=1 Tax=Gynuella sunshinyii YC6258 TaxID=1445510 RepID=A0A0C5VLH6_9GAMM|nr:hypothetical protein [Gynuella sunshinyii]AJQ95567.1 hypothetical Protein YC6258_03531 [Gynuella sunshinyii YC6258]